MTAITGYNANPSLVEVVAHVVYLTLVLGSYFRPIKVGKEMEVTVATRQPVTKGS